MGRYYAIYLPGKKSEDAIITGNIRRRKNLPEGTEIECVITERDGSAVESYPIPVISGRPQFSKNTPGKDDPKNALINPMK